MRDPFPAFTKVLDGPFDDPLSVVGGEDGMPTSAGRILKLAEANDWGFGVVSLVIRVNHPSGVPPIFISWHYSLDTGKWAFHGAMAANMQKLNSNDVRTVLEHPDALLPEDPDV